MSHQDVFGAAMEGQSLFRYILFLVTLLIGNVRAETIWSSYTYVLHGEAWPPKGQDASVTLSVYGEQQLYSLGQFLRNRYLGVSGRPNEEETTIVGIGSRKLNNSQLAIYSTTTDCITASALAFMQGLYPPSDGFEEDAGGKSTSKLPKRVLLMKGLLEGYQYPNIQTLSESDPKSIWINGHDACPEYWKAVDKAKDDDVMSDLYESSREFYQTLLSTTIEGVYNSSAVSSDNAPELYRIAKYLSHWDPNASNITEPDLRLLRRLAGEQQSEINGNLEASGKHKGDKIRAIAGQTLAAHVVAQFRAHIRSKGSSNKLTLAFAEHQPMFAFFSLAGLSRKKQSSAPYFRHFPSDGAAMIFELFSLDSHPETSASVYPDPDHLRVRFLYRNSPGFRGIHNFGEHAIFGREDSEESGMKWTDFQRAVRDLADIDVRRWCNTCGAKSVFCAKYELEKYSVIMSPVMGGLVGAGAAFAFMGLSVLIFVLISFFCERRPRALRDKDGSPGFRGADKKAPDQHVSGAKTETRQEREGSIELQHVGSNRNDASGLADDDVSSLVGLVPVRPLERV